jgi:hypothetical protein
MFSDRNSPRPQARDRAALVTGIILDVIANAFRAWLYGNSMALANVRAEIERLIRDEIHDVKREAAGERVAGEDAAP